MMRADRVEALVLFKFRLACRRFFSVARLCLLALLAGCAVKSADDTLDARALMTPFLEGEERFCAEDLDCRSGLCTWGSCAGILSADRGWMSEKIAGSLRTALEDADLETGDAIEVLRVALADDTSHVPMQRARILRTWRALDPASAGEAAQRLLGESTPGLLRFEAGRTRVTLGDREAAQGLIEMLRAGRTELAWFLLPEWPFFAAPERAAILAIVEKGGTPELRERLTTIER